MTLSEASRVRAVQALGVMGSAPDPEFDRLARLVGHIAHATYAHICFIDGTHQYIKAREGDDFPRLLPIENSICAEAVLTQSILVITDFASDHRRHCRDLHERYGYSSSVSAPIRLPSNHIVGAIAVLSRERLSLTERQMSALEECAEFAGREAIIKRPGTQARSAGGSPKDVPRAQDALRTIMASHIRVLRAVSDGVIIVRGDGSITFANTAAERMLGRLSGSLLDETFEEAVIHSGGQGESSKGGSPVLAALGDGAERLVRSALFCRAKGDAVRVGYVVSPILAEARAIGAVVVFRALDREEFSNGVDLRNTLREVSKLKEQLAKAEAAQRTVGALPHRVLPSLTSRTPVDFDRLLNVIREERADQSMRAQATGATGSDVLRAFPAPVVPGWDGTVSKLSPGVPRVLSRTERWLASEVGR